MRIGGGGTNFFCAPDLAFALLSNCAPDFFRTTTKGTTTNHCSPPFVILSFIIERANNNRIMCRRRALKFVGHYRRVIVAIHSACGVGTAGENFLFKISIMCTIFLFSNPIAHPSCLCGEHVDMGWHTHPNLPNWMCGGAIQHTLENFFIYKTKFHPFDFDTYVCYIKYLRRNVRPPTWNLFTN